MDHDLSKHLDYKLEGEKKGRNSRKFVKRINHSFDFVSLLLELIYCDTHDGLRH